MRSKIVKQESKKCQARRTKGGNNSCLLNKMQARMSFWLTGYSSQFLIWMRFGDHHTRWSFFTLIMYSTLLCEWRSITDSIQIRGLTYKRKSVIWYDVIRITNWYEVKVTSCLNMQLWHKYKCNGGICFLPRIWFLEHFMSTMCHTN